MSNLSSAEVEEWLDSHPDASLDYFLRKMDLSAINSWLVSHGFRTVDDYESSSKQSSGATENAPPAAAVVLPEEPSTSTQATRSLQPFPNGSGHRRSNSKRCLRHDFAKAKSKSMFRTQEHDPQNTASRKNSLKEMRKYTSLPPSSINMLSHLIESKVRLPQSLPYHNKDTKKDLLQIQGERVFFLNMIRDVATELDLKFLSQKTVDNLAVLLDCDGASLFLIETQRGGRQSLVSKVFDLHSGASSILLPCGSISGSDNEVQVPWGVGVLGHVADTGETVNLQVACEDPRFDDEVDRITGYHTESLLCMPVRNSSDHIIGVAQVVNKNPDIDYGNFTKADEKLFETYLQFVGIAITNAQIVDTSRKEYERNRNLLEVIHGVFEEQTSLEKVLFRMLQRAQRLLLCQRATVLLLDDTTDMIRFSQYFELTSPFDENVEPPPCGGKSVSSVPKYLLEVAENVVTSGQVVNVPECSQGDTDDNSDIKCLLAMPIHNSHYQIIGVTTIINKLNSQPFDENDEHLFEAFSIFCGLGLHNTVMYIELEKGMARQKVALEVLSYHSTASNKEVEQLMEEPVPCADDINLFSLSFNDFSLEPDEMVKAAVSMFLELGLVKRFSIEEDTLYRFLITVKRNYRDVPYHNWRHAFNVSQVMFAILMGIDMTGTFSELEVLGMIVGCLCHDVDHRGTNNAFQQKTRSPLVLLYGTTNTMEHHHFNHAVTILSSENHNIFSGLSPDEYSKVINILKHSILATDLSVYFENRAKFAALVESRSYSWELDEHRDLLRSMLMTASDLAASTKPWEVQKKVAQLVTTEFFVQGDKEREQLHITPQPLMDRERRHELPQLQIRWISDVCMPLYKTLCEMNPKLSPLYEGACENKRQWQKIVDDGSWNVDELDESNA